MCEFLAKEKYVLKKWQRRVVTWWIPTFPFPPGRDYNTLSSGYLVAKWYHRAGDGFGRDIRIHANRPSLHVVTISSSLTFEDNVDIKMVVVGSHR